MEEKRIAKNGIPVYGLTNENNHSFFISMFLKAGCIYESEDENGITHFLEHAAIRNVNKLMGDGLYRELDKYGMEFNASTYSEMVQFYISGSSRHFKTAAEIISRLLSPIVLSRSELDAERLRVKAEIREVGDKSTLAFISGEEVWRDTSLARPITGTLGSVSGITLAKLERYNNFALLDILTLKLAALRKSQFISLCFAIYLSPFPTTELVYMLGYIRHWKYSEYHNKRELDKLRNRLIVYKHLSFW